MSNISSNTPVAASHLGTTHSSVVTKAAGVGGCGGACRSKANHGDCPKPIAKQCLGCLRRTWQNKPELRQAITAAAAQRSIDTTSFA